MCVLPHNSVSHDCWAVQLVLVSPLVSVSVSVAVAVVDACYVVDVRPRDFDDLRGNG